MQLRFSGTQRERTTAAASLRLVRLETLPGRERYRFAVTPPWHKAV